jgi:para-aminobenzoate synthetase/4-amino-4-deoxychorismate lyase
LTSGSPTLVFDFASRDHGPLRLCFTDPVSIVVANSRDEVRPALRQVEAAVAAGAYAAGYVSYEAAPAFDPAFDVREGVAMPLVWFGVFREPVEVTPFRGDAAGGELQWQPDVSDEAYAEGIARIRNAIWEGAVYQVNYTMRLRTRFRGDPYSYYLRMREAQRADYCAYLDLGRHKILSASPELFFRRKATRS